MLSYITSYVMLSYVYVMLYNMLRCVMFMFMLYNMTCYVI